MGNKKGRAVALFAVAAAVMAVVLAGCSESDRSAEAGRGPAWRLAGGEEQGSAAGGTGGRGQWQGEAAEAGRQGRAERVERGPQDPVTAHRQAPAIEEKGDLVTVTGVLSEKDGHWYLESDGREYELGFGRPDYLEGTGIALAAGEVLTVRGHLIEGGELSVVTCDVDGRRFAFRTEEGVPLWSGRMRGVVDRADSVDGRAARGGGGGRGRSG